MTHTENSPTGRAYPTVDPGHVPHLDLVTRVRHVLEFVGVLAATALFWSWLLMGSSALRDTVTTACAIALLVVVLIVFALQRAAGSPSRSRVLVALGERAASQSETGRPGTLPGRLKGAGTRYANMTLTLFAIFLCGGLPLALGLGNPVPTGKAVALKEAGVERGYLPVERVLKSEKTSTGRSTSGWDSTVRLALPGSGTDGSNKRVTHRLITGEELKPGDKVYAAYAPSRADLGVIADNDKAWVERKLSGPALNDTWYGILGLLWGVSVIGWFASFKLTTRSQRFPRRLRGDEATLRARVTGGHNRVGVGDVICLTVAGKDSAKDIDLIVAEEAERHFTAVGSQEGTLVWHPVRNRRRGRKAAERIGANFVADAGWHIPGELRVKDAESAGSTSAAPGDIETEREADVLDIHRAWPLTVSRLLTWLALGMGVCVVVLTLPVQLGEARVVLGSVGTFGPLLIGTVQAIRKAAPGSENGERATAV